MKKDVVPKLRQEVKVKVDIVTSDGIKIYYTGKFQNFTAMYIIKWSFFSEIMLQRQNSFGPDYTARTSQADLGRYFFFLQVH